ncbi:pentapeptide repeat-containing protein [Pontibacter vulgaris]|uniref:pentapeptide repeat-containing protein n=1 Tax=Pontibacter vulgaris TaxID=2905679 RepID=UPI001FA7179C|nr:pentapeptide repeat-containing protein [Pontibacter vulgaris]
MRKKVYFLLAFFMLPLLTMAQTKVDASEIIAKINRGEAVSYKNAEITGDLDMTKLKNMKLKNEKDSKYDSKEYISTVTAPIIFENCTFKGDVLAYFNPDNGINIVNQKNEVYNTNFEKEVRFEDCTFEKATAFKYSEFEEKVSFAGSRFKEEALFKYSEFEKRADFNKADFRELANFKYVTFPVAADFKGATFDDDADFKYAKFENGVNMQQATFNDLANFKYTKFSAPANLKGARFNGSTDFKYTKLGNRSVDLATLQARNK